MSIVTLVSGGIDSSAIALLLKERGIRQFPLFVDYGQLAVANEWKACKEICRTRGLPRPKRARLSGYGELVRCGLTDETKDVNLDAFLPGRNLIFLLAASAHAYEMNANTIAIGLLSEDFAVFPDQTASFLKKAQAILRLVTGRDLKVIAPLMALSKSDVLVLARDLKLSGTYSCHSGKKKPCGRCISCLETTIAKQLL